MRPLLALGAVVALVTASVVPYVRNRTGQGPNGGHCLAWPAGVLEYHPNATGAPDLGPAAFAAIDASVATWARQMDFCGNLTLVVGPRSTSRTVGFNDTPTASNENLVLFRTRDCTDVVPADNPCLRDGDCGNSFDCWEFAPGTLAITTTNFATSNGQLLDADIELNAASHLFTTVDGPPCTDVDALTCTSIDVQNTVTHELGHTLGLAHSPDGRSTMFAGAERGETKKRVLDDGSQEFVCTAYPQGQQSRDCDGSPLQVRVPGTSCGAAPVGLLALGGLLVGRLREPRRNG
jgi:hypothetical protein